MTPHPIFPARLRSLRVQAGLSVPALARAAGLTRQQIHGYESGRNEPKLSTLVRLASALDVTVSTLVGEQVVRYTGTVVAKLPPVIDPT